MRYATREEEKLVPRLYELIWKLQGSDDLVAYDGLFPGHHGAETIIPHYDILNDKTNRELLKLLHQRQQNGRMSLDDIAATLSIKPDEVRSRIEFFRNNGMRKDVSLRE